MLALSAESGKRTESQSREPRYLRAGAATGAAAAIIAALVQLPLHSPSDTLFNSASVTFGSLVVGAAAGFVWQELTKRGLGRWAVFAIWFAVFDTVFLATLYGETQLDRTISYVLPLAGIIFASTGLLTPWLARRSLLKNAWLVLIVIVLAVALGLGLVGMGDVPSGHLELPPRGS